MDHIGGSQAFKDAVIVGHKNCVNQIDSLHKTIEDIDVKEGMAPRLKLARIFFLPLAGFVYPRTCLKKTYTTCIIITCL